MSEPLELSRRQCQEFLAGHGVGRVAFGTPVGPRIAPVSYVLAGGQIVFRAAPYSEVGTYAPDTEVAFETDDAEAAGSCAYTTVVAFGCAEVVDPPECRLHDGEGHRDDRWIRVRAHDVIGLRLGG